MFLVYWTSTQSPKNATFHSKGPFPQEKEEESLSVQEKEEEPLPLSVQEKEEQPLLFQEEKEHANDRTLCVTPLSSA